MHLLQDKSGQGCHTPRKLRLRATRTAPTACPAAAQPRCCKPGIRATSGACSGAYAAAVQQAQRRRLTKRPQSPQQVGGLAGKVRQTAKGHEVSVEELEESRQGHGASREMRPMCGGCIEEDRKREGRAIEMSGAPSYTDHICVFAHSKPRHLPYVFCCSLSALPPHLARQTPRALQHSEQERQFASETELHIGLRDMRQRQRPELGGEV